MRVFSGWLGVGIGLLTTLGSVTAQPQGKLTAEQFAARFPGFLECESAARGYLQQNEARGWTLMSACLGHDDWAVLGPLLERPWVDVVKRRADGTVVVARVLSRRPFAVPRAIGELAHVGIPITSIGLAERDGRAHQVFFRAQVKSIRTTTAGPEVLLEERVLIDGTELESLVRKDGAFAALDVFATPEHQDRAAREAHRRVTAALKAPDRPRFGRYEHWTRIVSHDERIDGKSVERVVRNPLADVRIAPIDAETGRQVLIRGARNNTFFKKDRSYFILGTYEGPVDGVHQAGMRTRVQVKVVRAFVSE